METDPPAESYLQIAETRISAARRENTTKVDLSRLSLNLIPESLRGLHHLRRLDISANRISFLPDWFSEFQELEELIIHDNPLEKLPESFGSLKALKDLTIMFCKLSELPDSFENLSNLADLTLSHNNFGHLPSSIRKLSSLRYLDIGGNKNDVVPEWISDLKELRSFDHGFSDITYLPDTIGKLSKLESLLVYSSKLSSLPSSIDQLSKLDKLVASKNKLTTLPTSLGRISNLRYLDLSENNLNRLPQNLRQLRSLQYLFLHSNPKLNLPLEVLGPSSEDVFLSKASDAPQPGSPEGILDYYFRIHPAKKPSENSSQPEAKVLRELKVILVGRGEVGKSTLVDVLNGKKFVPGKQKTEGIAICRRPLSIDGGPATALIWDFGGQEIMHGTHQFFLTHRSLYLVVVDGRHDRAKLDAEYWLKLIRAFGGDSPVIVILNKQSLHAFDIDREYLASKYGVERHLFFPTDCANKASILQLENAIKAQASRMLAAKELFPAEWWLVKQRLGAMKEKGEDFFSDEKYEKICSECKVKSTDSGILLRRLAELGTVVSFPDDVKLSALSVLNPEWVTDGIYRVLNNDSLQKSGHGQLKWSELKAILPAKRWPEKCHRYLVELMRKFELSFPLEGEPDVDLIPELLPDKTPPLISWNPTECLVFVYQYPVLPQGVLPRFITRTHTKSAGHERWRSGVVLEREGAEALVRADYDRNQVIIWIRGVHADARRALLAIIRDDFAVIHARIKGLDPKELVAIPGHPTVTVAFEDLLQDERDGQLTTRVTVDGKREERRIDALLNGVESPEDRLKRRKIEEKFIDAKTIIQDNRIMGHNVNQNITKSIFHGPVAAVMENCSSIIQNQPPGERKELLQALEKQIGAVIGGPEDDKQQLKTLVASRLSELMTGVTSGKPDRAWYSVSAEGLLQASKNIKEISGEVSETLKNLGKSFWPDFKLS